MKNHHQAIPNTQTQALLSLLPTEYVGDQNERRMYRTCGAYGRQERHVQGDT
jgi:hypothetical protein